MITTQPWMVWNIRNNAVVCDGGRTHNSFTWKTRSFLIPFDFKTLPKRRIFLGSLAKIWSHDHHVEKSLQLWALPTTSSATELFKVADPSNGSHTCHWAVLAGCFIFAGCFFKSNLITWHRKPRRLRDQCVIPAEWEWLSGGTNLQHQEAKKCSLESIGWSAPVKKSSHHHVQSPDSRMPAVSKKIGFGPGAGWWSTDLAFMRDQIYCRWKGSAR